MGGATDDLHKLAIVATSDCDLAQKKHARTLTLVPVVPATTIMEKYLIPDDCEKKRDIIEQFILKRFDISSEKDRSTRYAILDGLLTGARSEHSPSLIAGINFILDRLDTISFREYNALMVEMKIGARKIDSFKTQMRSRGDLLILPESKVIGVKGHIAWVRQLWQIPTGDIALRTSETAQRRGERVARLDSPYRYRLTQLIAQVFSDIGLSDAPDSLDEALDGAYGK